MRLVTGPIGGGSLPLGREIAAALGEKFRWTMFFKVQAARTQYLKGGDRVEARIRSEDGAIDLGVQRNRIVDEAP